MGTYFPTSSNQRGDDAATMLHLQDRLASSYSETPVLPLNTMMYTNFPNSDPSTSQQEVLLNFGGSRGVEHHLSTWKDGRNDMLYMQENSNVLQNAPNFPGQGLSLTLSTHIQYQNDNPHFSSILHANTSMSEEDTYRSSQTRDNDISSYGINSKYLKAAQELLDEVVSVKKTIKGQNSRKEIIRDSKEVEGEVGDGASDSSLNASKESKSSPNELSVAEKQELQNRMTKLLSMLDEVDRRYRQYYHQMQIVVSSFDAVAGSGAAKPYTALALHTISRHFRCLRDAINGQVHAARKSLGEEDGSFNDKGVGISRLRYVDQQLKQQRALQQLGMMQSHAWRPQRGLPETSVSILRAWLFEHFLHPYPKDSDKIMLARQTGLTRSQVSNWFINARVRLWKPMVEEMYKEETGDADMDSNSSSEPISRTLNRAEDLQQSETSTGRPIGSISDAEMAGTDANPVLQDKLLRTNFSMVKAKGVQNQTNNFSTFTGAMLQNDRLIAASAEYDMSEIERFGNVRGGVSLTLGLQQCEGGTMGMDDDTHHHGFAHMRGNDVYNAGGLDMGAEGEEYECMDSGNRTYRVGSTVLPSFT